MVGMILAGLPMTLARRAKSSHGGRACTVTQTERAADCLPPMEPRIAKRCVDNVPRYIVVK
jgi:hypothetical protein